MNILAINPWIFDFAAYDFWLKPYGFLSLLTYLSTNKDIKIDYIDCLESKLSKGTFGRGKYFCQEIENPPVFKSLPRSFKRYGITPENLEKQLKGKNPDYILLTSSMTYWYPAIVEIMKLIKVKFPKTPTILGGTYATLCPEHAKENTSCDFVFTNTDLKQFFDLLHTNFDPKKFYSTLPAYEIFYDNLEYIPLRTSWGCPFNCAFCAIKRLSPSFFRLKVEKVLNFILKYSDLGTNNFVLYDDAFLYKNDYAKTLLTKLKNKNICINFHTPNAMHLKFLDLETAYLLKAAGFINPHFGLETLNKKLQQLWMNKVNKKDLIRGVKNLKKAGFKDGEFSMYLLLGYPNQDLKALKYDIEFVNSLGARVSLSEFSPTPGTAIFEEFKNSLKDPLLHNNSAFSLHNKDKIRDFWEIKNFAKNLNRQLNNKQNSMFRNKLVPLNVES